MTIQFIDGSKNFATSGLRTNHRKVNRRTAIRVEHTLPVELELTEPNITRSVIIPRPTELDVLRLFIATKPNLRGFVEAANHMVDIVVELRLLEVICMTCKSRLERCYNFEKERRTFEEQASRNADKYRPMEVTLWYGHFFKCDT